jgi:flagellar protein FlgJ
MDITNILASGGSQTDSKIPQEMERLARSFSASSQQAAGPMDLRKAAQEFEGYFIAYLLKEMRNTVPTGFIENKAGQQFYTFYDQEIGRLAAQSGGLGLADMLHSEMTRQNLR